MENDELKDLWKKGIENKIDIYSKEELNDMLLLKARSYINKFYAMDVLPLLTFVLLFFLIVASVTRMNDISFVLNNALLGLIVVVVLILSFISYRKMNNYDPQQPLRDWLKYRINALEKSVNSQLGYFVTPLVYMLMYISLQVFLQNQPYWDVIISTPFLVSFLLVTIAVALPTIYFTNRWSRKKHLTNLDHLRQLYSQIQKESDN